MTKQELIAQIAERTGLTKAQAEKALNATTSTITDALAEGESVTLVGFGTFKIHRREARTGRNPQTGGAVQIPAGFVPKFSAGQGLKDAVN